MIPLKLPATISPGGRLVVLDPDTLRSWCERYAEKDIEIVFRKRTASQSSEQRGYFFGHVIPAIASYTGYSEDELYGLMKEKFLERFTEDGQRYVLGISSLDKNELSQFIQEVVEFGQSLGAEIYPSDKYGGQRT